MKSWDLDPTTGDYILTSAGVPKETDSLRIPAYVRVKTQRGRWLYAPDVDYGSDFYLTKKHRTTQDGSTLEAVAAKALKPLIDDGRASQIDVTAKTSFRNAAGIEIKVTDSQGESDQLTFAPIGA